MASVQPQAPPVGLRAAGRGASLAPLIVLEGIVNGEAPRTLVGHSAARAQVLLRSIKPSSCGRDLEIISSSIHSSDEEAGAGRESQGKDIIVGFSWALETQPRDPSHSVELPHLDVNGQ